MPLRLIVRGIPLSTPFAAWHRSTTYSLTCTSEIGGVRSRCVIRQYAAAWNLDAFSGTQCWVGVRVIFTRAHLEKLSAVIGDLLQCGSRARTSDIERTNLCRTTREWVRDKRVVWKLHEALNGLRRVSLLLQNFLFKIITKKLGFMSAVVYHTETSVKMLVLQCAFCSRQWDNVANHTDHGSDRATTSRVLGDTIVEHTRRCQRDGERRIC